MASKTYCFIQRGRVATLDSLPTHSEADIERKICNMLEGMGLDVRQQVPHDAMGTGGVNQRKRVIDVVAFRQGLPVITFEVKTPKGMKKVNHKSGTHETNQGIFCAWMTNMGIPSFMVSSVEEAGLLAQRFIQ